MNNQNKTLAIIPCTKDKIWDLYPNLGPVMAKNVYTNSFHALARTYISLYTKHWVILSAKYGFLDPKDWIEVTYDVTFDREDDPYISDNDLKSQIVDKKLHEYGNILIIANNRYVEKLKKAFLDFPSKLHVPFENIEDDFKGILRLNKTIQQTRGMLCYPI